MRFLAILTALKRFVTSLAVISLKVRAMHPGWKFISFETDIDRVSASNADILSKMALHSWRARPISLIQSHPIADFENR